MADGEERDALDTVWLLPETRESVMLVWERVVDDIEQVRGELPEGTRERGRELVRAALLRMAAEDLDELDAELDDEGGS